MVTELKTPRLTLREFVIGDAPFIVNLLNQPSFIRFIGDKGVRTVDDAAKYLNEGPIESYKRHGFGLYLVQLDETNEPVGMCGLLKRDTLPQPDLGFAFLPEFWRKGYALEAATAVLDHARNQLRLERVLAITSPDNEASIELLQRLGFQFERIIQSSNNLKLFSLAIGETL